MRVQLFSASEIFRWKQAKGHAFQKSSQLAGGTKVLMSTHIEEAKRFEMMRIRVKIILLFVVKKSELDEYKFLSYSACVVRVVNMLKQ